MGADGRGTPTPNRPAGRALVIAGGDAPGPDDLAGEAAWEWVVAADSGLDHAEALGLSVDRVVGDLDSVSPSALARARAAGVAVDEHPRDKDATDLALALDAAVALGAAGLLVVGLGGGRPDHLLANLLLLAAPAYAEVEIDARTADARYTVVRSRPRALRGRPGEVVTLLPLHGVARKVHTEGLRWRLDGEDLPHGSTRAVSNELTGTDAWALVGEGVVLAVQPH